jgi:hypothetical protein
MSENTNENTKLYTVLQASKALGHQRGEADDGGEAEAVEEETDNPYEGMFLIGAFGNGNVVDALLKHEPMTVPDEKLADDDYLYYSSDMVVTLAWMLYSQAVTRTDGIANHGDVRRLQENGDIPAFAVVDRESMLDAVGCSIEKAACSRHAKLYYVNDPFTVPEGAIVIGEEITD